MDQPESRLHSDVRSVWLTLGPGSMTGLTEARVQLHYAAQLVSSAGYTYGTQAKDWSHTALTWDGEKRLLVGSRIPAPKGFQIGLGLVDMALVVFDEHERKVDEFGLDGISLDEARQWLEDVLLNRLGRDNNFELLLPEHEMPDHTLGGGGHFRFRPQQAFDEMDKLFGNASEFLNAFANMTDDASPVRTWPHHFDTATLIELDGDSADGQQRTIGVGFSPGDEHSDEPYCYVTPWPYPPTENLPADIAPGRWQTEGWVGAILPIGELIQQRSRDSQIQVLDRFVRVAVEASRALMETETAQ